MAPIELETILKIPVNAIGDKDIEDQYDKIYDELTEFDPGGNVDALKLYRLFLVTRSILKYKGTMADVALAELEEIAESKGIKIARREEELQNQVEELQRELRTFKRVNGQQGDSAKLKRELVELENHFELLQQQLQMKEKELENEKELSEKHLKEAAVSEKEKVKLKGEVIQLKEELGSFQRQLESLEAEYVLSMEKKQLAETSKMREKNQQIHQLLVENEELELANKKLCQQVTEMRSKLEDAVEQMDKTTNDYIKTKESLQQLESVTESQHKEEEMLLAEIEDLRQQNELRAETDDEIMETVTQRVEEWKTVLMSKDEEIAKLQDLVRDLKTQAAVARLDAEKTTLAVLTKAIEERDQQIITLKQQLDQATKDIENNVHFIDDLKTHFEMGTSEVDKEQASRIFELQSSLQEKTDALKKTQEMLGKVEEETKHKDKLLTETLSRMRQYEMGEYGLADAVAEIKLYKNQVIVRDKQIEDLIQQVNKLEIHAEELFEENEVIREKLGMEARQPLNIIRNHHKDRHLNVLLQQEIEKLEEERVELQQKLRELSKQVKEKEQESSKYEKKDIPTLYENIQKECIEVKQTEFQELKDLILKLQCENNELRARNTDINEENQELHQGMKEILQSIKEQNGKTDTILQSPALERLIKAIETKEVNGSYNATWRLKSEINHLKGHNDALQTELRNARRDFSEILSNMRERKENIQRYQGQLLSSSAIPPHQPETFPMTSEELLNPALKIDNRLSTLNSHLLNVLHEFKKEEEKNENLEKELERYCRELAVVRSQLGQLYEEHLRVKKEYTTKAEKFKKDKKDLLEERAIDKRLLETLEKGDEEIKQRTAEMSRKMMTLRISESALNRKFAILQEEENVLVKENEKVKKDMVDLEIAVQERIGFLERVKELNIYRIYSLQKVLQKSVPTSELEAANRQIAEISIKYRDLLEHINDFTSKTQEEEKAEYEVNRLKSENLALKPELETDREKLHRLEIMVQQLGREEGSKEDMVVHSENVSLSQRMAMVEMKEINERQRADHATHLYQQQQSTLQRLEERNIKLEEKFNEVVHLNVDIHQENKELQERLSVCVSKEVHEADEKRINELEELEITLRQDVSRLKEIADIAQHQVEALESTRTNQAQKIQELQHHLIVVQAHNDEQFKLGKLYRQILTLQLSEGSLNQKAEKMKQQISKLETKCLKLEQRCQEKEETTYQVRHQTQSRVCFLSKIIQEMRRQYCGAVPLAKQEKLAFDLVQLRSEKLELKKDLELTQEKLNATEGKAAQLEVRAKGMEEMLQTFQNETASQKLLEWYKKLEDLQISYLQSRRKSEFTSQQASHLENVVSHLENKVSSLEELNIKLEKNIADNQLEWEKRELELVEQVERLQKKIDEMTAISFNQTETTSEQDKSLSTTEQLHQAFTVINVKSQMLSESQEECKTLKQKLWRLEEQLKEAEISILSRNKVIGELRLLVPDSSKTVFQPPVTLEDKLMEAKRALKVSQSRVEYLEARLIQKEESLSHYKDLLVQARCDLGMEQQQYEKELKTMEHRLLIQDIIHSRNQKCNSDLDNKTSAYILAHKHLSQITQLEELVAEKEQKIVLLTQQNNISLEEIEMLKKGLVDKIKEMEASHKCSEQKLTNMFQEAQQKLELKELEIKDQQIQVDTLEKEVTELRETALKSPSRALKNMVERLSCQISDKEKQLQALSKALTDLRANMVNAVKESMTAQQQHASNQLTVQEMIESKTKPLQLKIKQLELQNGKLKMENQRHYEEREMLNSKLEQLKSEIERKKTVLEMEKEELKKQVHKAKSHTQQHASKSELQAKASEVVKLRKEIQSLKEQLKKQQPAEKPYDQDEKTARSQREVLQWEERKNCQQTVEKLQGQLKNKEQELEKAQKSNKLLREQIDESRKTSMEREKTIAALQKVAEKLQMDNEKLKLQVSENKIKNNERELATVGIQTLKSDSESKNLSTSNSPSRIKTRNQKTNDLWLEIEKLREELTKVQHAKDQLQQQLSDCNADLDTVRSQLPTPHTVEPDQYKAYVLHCMYENKVKGLENEIQQKNHLLKGIRKILKEAAEREKRLQQEHDELEERVKTYETIECCQDDDLESAVVQAKLRIRTLENQNTPGNSETDGWQYNSSKKRQFDALLQENSELSVNVRMMEIELKRKDNELQEIKKFLEREQKENQVLQQK
ncbi:centrosomal protein of 290 kDa-like isoform X2 [Tachypleus tridentatus]|uniref:centrosomal protein of 290 kDa-like isoform X2 n=1 Tax=Tachypleus tridentatus TaxID=6853 RepID=UPI003FD68A16